MMKTTRLTFGEYDVVFKALHYYRDAVIVELSERKAINRAINKIVRRQADSSSCLPPKKEEKEVKE